MSDLPTKAEVAEYRSQGVVLLRGIFQDWIDRIAAGIERNMAEPGPYASENLKPGEGGRFFDDYCNWQRIPEFREFVQYSPAAEAAAQVDAVNEGADFSRSRSCQGAWHLQSNPMAPGRALLFCRWRANGELLDTHGAG